MKATRDMSRRTLSPAHDRQAIELASFHVLTRVSNCVLQSSQTYSYTGIDDSPTTVFEAGKKSEGDEPNLTSLKQAIREKIIGVSL